MWATHLVGGSIGYEYLGQTAAGYYRYKIILTTYTNCQETGPNAANPIYWNGPEANIQDAGIYAHDAINNPTGGAATKTKIADVPLTLVSSLKIEPNLPSGCGTGVSTCIFKGVYEGTVDLGTLDPNTGTISPSFTGYHVFYERCCRNNVIDNLNNLMSMGFYAYIAPDLVTNNSPVFTDDPVPFLCIGDTVTLLNSAYDPDGDEIQFSFVTPYDDNVSSSQNPAPNPNNFLQWPIDEVTYQFGYSTALPFGASGGSNIVANNGLTEYYTTAGGNYVVAVELKEYRNNILVGVSRRDIQLLAITCPANPPPVINPNVGTTSQSFTLEEGETLCFDFGYYDPNGDSLTLTANGQIFDPTIINPPATVTPNPIVSAPGVDTLSTEFCWTTSCGQSQALPYQFQISAEDRGCPPKTTNAVYEITVNSVDPPTDIFGDVVYCQNANGSYWTPNLPGVTYSWSINGGNVVQSFGDSVVVNWTTAGTGTVTLNAVNAFGCASAPIAQTITVTPAPSVDAGANTSICEGDTIPLIGTTSATPGYTASWSPSLTLDNSSSINTNAFPLDTTTYYLTVDIGGGCSGIDSIQIAVISNTIDAGNDTIICAGDTVLLQAIGDGDTFVWTPSDSLDQVNSATTNAWPNTTTTYIVEASNSSFGCNTSDTITVNVNPTPSSNANFILNGSTANLGNNEYQITQNIGALGGSAWNNSYLNLNQPFDIDVDLNFGNVDLNGADGIAFVLQQTSTAVVSTGGTIGYGNISPSLDVEFDTYCNSPACGGGTDYGDIPADHVAIQTNGILDHNSANNLVPPIAIGATGNVEDGLWHNATFSWDPNSMLFEVSFEGVTLISQTIDIINSVFSGNPNVYWGFTASTGGASNDHRFRFNSATFFNALINQDICSGDSLILNAPVDADTYNWSPNTGIGGNLIIDDNTLKIPEFFPTSTTTFFFEGISVSGCTYRDTFDINVNALPNVDAGPDQEICFGLDATLNSSGNAISYSWDNGVVDGVAFPVTTTQDYILTGEDANGCINLDTVTITVNALPNVDAGNDIVVCIGDSTQLNASGAEVYIWTPSNDLSNDLVFNPWASPPSTVQYNLVGTDTNGCINQDSILISVNPLPTLSTGNNPTICEGDSVSIIAFGGTVYNWITTDSISDTTVSNPTVWPTSTTTYFVLVSDVNTCADTTSVTVNVNPKPNVDAGTAQDICFGDTTQFNASGASTYLWDTNSDINLLTDPNSDVWPVDTTTYFITGTDANLCTNIDSVTINIMPLPNAEAGPNLWVCPGGSIQLDASGGEDYLWSPAASLDDPSLVNPTATPPGNQLYQVQVTDSNNCLNIDSVLVEVFAAVPTDAGGDTLFICENLSINLGGNPTSPAGTIYTWSPSAFVNNDTDANPDASPISPTWFIVETSNDTCSGIDSIFIDLYPTINPDAGTNQQICIGDSIPLLASGGVEYVWTPILNSSGDSILSNDTINNPNSFPIDTTLFNVTVTDSNGCIGTDSVEITVNSLPNFDLGPNTSICIFDSLMLQASDGDIYSWTPNHAIDSIDVANPIIFTQVDTTYFVGVTDSNGCFNSDSIEISVNPLPNVSAGLNDTICYGSTTQLIATGALNYQWSPIDSLSNPSIPYPTADPSINTNYIVTGTDGQLCSNSDTVEIVVLPLPNAFAGSDTSICPGQSTPLNATGGIGYKWITNINLTNFLIANPIASPDSTTQYVVQVTDTNNCQTTDTVIVNVFAPAEADAGFNISSCANVPVQLNASGGELYNWTPANYVNHDTINNPLAFPDQDMDFIVEVTDSNGCMDTDTMRITVFTISINNDTLFCIGDSMQANVGGDPATIFSWTPTTGVSDSTSFEPWLSPTVTTTYTLTATNAQGCTFQDEILIEVPNPIASFDTTQLAGCEGVVINFTNTSNTDLSFVWSFSDGTNSTDADVEKVFDFNQLVGAILEVTDQYGCQDTATYNYNSLGFDDYFNIDDIPNVFTPNNDGNNDVFEIQVAGKLYECTVLKIFNRWGQVQFLSSGNNIKWDGRNSVGMSVPDGTYFYTLSIKEKQYSGAINVYK